MELQARRASDALRAVDGVVDSYLRHSDLGSRRIANLAATIAIENSGARSGSLLLDEGGGLAPALAIREDMTEDLSPLAEDSQASVRRAESTAELVVQPEMLAAPIVLDGKVRGVLHLNEFPQPPDESVQKLASSVASRIASLLKNAELVEALDRSHDDLRALARLSERLAVGVLDDNHLQDAIEHAVRSTASEGGALGLLSAEGELAECFCSGIGSDQARARLTRAGHAWEDDQSLARAFSGATLLEPLSTDGLRRKNDDMGGGFLSVFRSTGEPYHRSERSFLRAIANLLSGALARREYFRRASEDELTATGSRFALQLALAEAEARARETGLPFGILLIDIDRFKEINDDYGHLVGDEILKDVARVLRERLRALDSVSRYGGDEFVVVLPDTAAPEALRLGDELRELVKRRRFAAIADSISVSLGVADSAPDQTANEALRRADLALYRSKHEGRDRVTCYREDLE